MSKIETIGQEIAKPELMSPFIGFRPGTVIIDFKRSVTSFQIDPDAAELFARTILKHAWNARQAMKAQT